MRLKAAIPAVVVAGAIAVGASACGSSSDSSDSSSASAKSTAPVATVPDLSKGVSTSVALDAGFVKALTTLKLTPGLVGKATMPKTGTLSFPITGGNVTYYGPDSAVTPYVQGKIQHEGSGLSLTAGSTKVELTNFTVDPGASILYGDVSANGKTAATQAPLFTLDGTTLKPLQTSGDDAILTGTKVEIYPSAATLLDQTFKTSAITPNFLVGVATITVATK